VTPAFDTKFNAARGFVWVASFFGLLCFLTLALSGCCPLSRARLKGMSCYYFFAFFFQGLTFIIFKSDVCQKGFFDDYFANDPDQQPPPDDLVTSVSCGLATGSKMAIAATVFYFWCMTLIPKAIPPSPVGINPDRPAAGAGDTPAAEDAPAASSSA